MKKKAQKKLPPKTIEHEGYTYVRIDAVDGEAQDEFVVEVDPDDLDLMRHILEQLNVTALEKEKKVKKPSKTKTAKPKKKK